MRPMHLLAILVLGSGAAFADDPVTLTPTARQIDAKPSAVTLYRGRAAVTREATLALGQGVWDLRFPELPAAALEDSLQAKADGAARLLDVRSEWRSLADETGASPELAAALKERENVDRAMRVMAVRRSDFEASRTLLDSIAARAADDASRGLGTTLDPEKLRAQLSFLAKERESLGTSLLALETESDGLKRRLEALDARIAALGRGTRIDRTGVVTVAVPDAGSASVELTYQVGSATWRPTYNIRADVDANRLAIEYDATVVQASGEDWNDVRLTLSTSAPAAAAALPDVEPVYVDLYRRDEGYAVSRAAPPPPAAPAEADGDGRMFIYGGAGGAVDVNGDVERASAAASVQTSGPAVNFVLPRTVSFPSDADREQRTRIASIAAEPTFIHVASPVIAEGVYLRADATNASDFQILAGRANVFLGNDSVGKANLPDTAPGDDLELWFGIDKRVSAKRVLVKKESRESGVFSKSEDTTRQYRIDVTNSARHPVTVEVWDRVPVSRDESLKITTSDVTPPLAKDDEYVANGKPQGLMKWLLQLPAASGEGTPEPLSIRWITRVSRPVDAVVAPMIPD